MRSAFSPTFRALVSRAVVPFALAPFALSSAPPARSQQWYRGNTHVHTVNSDGTASPDVVVRWYKEHGYHFVVLTDHNLRTPVDGLNALFAVPGRFLVIAGVEVTDRVGRRPVHLNGINVRETVAPRGGSTASEAIIANARAIRGAGGVPQLNHPNGLLAAALTAAEIGAAAGVELFEVCCADFRGGGGRPSTEEIWDAVLSTGRILFGVAADDAHNFAPGSREPGTAWLMARAPELTAEALGAALERGDFYASTGPELVEYSADREGIRMRLSEAGGMRYRTYFIGAGGEVLGRDETLTPTYRFTGRERYVRARVERSDGTYAWTQPVKMRSEK